MSLFRLLTPERSTPELLYQEVRWASLLSYGVMVKLLGDLLPMEHQLSTSTLSRHVHQVAERLESELGDEQPSFIEGCPDQWYKLPDPGAPLVVMMAAMFTRVQKSAAKMDHLRSLSAKAPPETEPPLASGWCLAMIRNPGDDSLRCCKRKVCK